MSQEALELTRDLRWLPPSQGRHRAVYQRQLLVAWHRLWHSCRQLEQLLVELLKIFQALLLLNVFTNYLTEISLFFNLVVLIADAPFISPWRCYFYTVVCLAFHMDILLNFSIFGANQVKWKHLSVRLQQLWLALKALHVDYRNDTHCVAMLHQ
ncbi:putative gustatory receptor 58c, partial [Drosophila navojoa]